MIAKLKGTIDDLKPTELILDVHGVGYRLSIPFSTYEKIRGEQTASLLVHTYHREDTFRLFGFYSAEERELFGILLDISGIGPSMALSIISSISAGQLLAAVRDGNSGMLLKVPGIGKSKAEKLIFELKRKMKKLEHFASDTPATPSTRTDAVEALVSLGFDENKASAVVDTIVKGDDPMPLETVVKSALRKLSE
ncbi:MAG TPA: Holliday junction branch migration protein RuvA [Spirochaetota bacterium]|nr:Holliday junction branch migration protein RuvA [Spirochaetota bacterium]HPJ39916.1 Holliday junction branch migration protein RuvA [Spirochaetota bacterium]HPQ53048.1 Holliday junction branch migration protein RuvA [Spirochaetota bacterium]